MSSEQLIPPVADTTETSEITTSSVELNPADPVAHKTPSMDEAAPIINKAPSIDVAIPIAPEASTFHATTIIGECEPPSGLKDDCSTDNNHSKATSTAAVEATIHVNENDSEVAESIADRVSTADPADKGAAVVQEDVEEILAELGWETRGPKNVTTAVTVGKPKSKKSCVMPISRSTEGAATEGSSTVAQASAPQLAEDDAGNEKLQSDLQELGEGTVPRGKENKPSATTSPQGRTIRVKIT
ncbi:hypothetical protein PHLGIDRAFT_15243 [Phlebiopsis gigantea 11061_1 CR5-6]|uniref:Uncharacterized protein n=1 Tax=Phlebiopsis gigantea (strain 11061_1 CR5-6) TaxID=745531 RepID=A0A0C3PFJ5_PHLG1|nr:hypothetical protein PHLGIDRAFT_15243 [Phlebiopsis gigantea 11061_1 CR5-6]